MLVAAASDLSDLQQGLAALLPECKTRFTFASSGLLAQQIRNGAPYDVFLSANLQFVKDLTQVGLIRNDTAQVYAYGQLALWSKAGGVRFEDLGLPTVKRISVANPTLAPYGKAAIEALKSSPEWRTIEPKLVYGENVRQALQFAETGNADVCLVSYPLVRSRGGQLVEAKRYAPIPQAAGIIQRNGGNSNKGKEMLAKLLSPAGQQLLSGYGLLPAATGGKPERPSPRRP